MGPSPRASVEDSGALMICSSQDQCGNSGSSTDLSKVSNRAVEGGLRRSPGTLVPLLSSAERPPPSSSPPPPFPPPVEALRAPRRHAPRPRRVLGVGRRAVGGEFRRNGAGRLGIGRFP